MPREVSSEEIQNALSNTDNANVIKSVTLQYRNALSFDERRTCGLHALWRTLQKHDPTVPSRRDSSRPCNQKFTTSLYRHLHWECLRELKRKRSRHRGPLVTETLTDGLVAPEVARSGIEEYVALLPNARQREAIRLRFFHGYTYDELAEYFGKAKETARLLVFRAVKNLRKICLCRGGVLSNDLQSNLNKEKVHV